MDWNLVASLGGIALGLMGLLGSVAKRILDNPSRRLEPTLVSRRLIEPIRGSVLKMSAGGVKFSDPYFNTLTLKSTGRGEIRTADFDGGDPLRLGIEHNGPILFADFAGTIRARVLPRPESGKGTVVEIAPQLIRKGGYLSTVFMSSGPVSVLSASPFTGVKIARVDRGSAPVSSDVGNSASYVLVVSAFVFGLGTGALVWFPPFAAAIKSLFS